MASCKLVTTNLTLVLVSSDCTAPSNLIAPLSHASVRFDALARNVIVLSQFESQPRNLSLRLGEAIPSIDAALSHLLLASSLGPWRKV